MSTVQKYKNPAVTYNKNQYNKDYTTRVDAAQNVYTEEFKSFLQRVQDQYPTTLRQIPLDEPRIQVDLSRRFIDIENSEYRDFLSMAEDHRAETVYFEVDRYFEDVDLFNCTCIIEYINGGGHPRIYPVTLKDLYKSASFVVQAICFKQTGNYIRHQNDLLNLVSSDEQMIINTFLNLKNDGLIDFQEMSEILFAWSKNWIEKMKYQITK